MIKSQVKELLKDFFDEVKGDDFLANLIFFIAGIAALLIFAFFVYEP